MLNRVKSSLSESASAIKGILGRQDGASWSKSSGQGPTTQTAPPFRPVFHDHADLDVGSTISNKADIQTLRKEWKKYVKMHGMKPAEIEEQFRVVLDVLQRLHHSQSSTGKLDLSTVLDKESGFCVELGRRLVAGIEDLAWVVDTNVNDPLELIADQHSGLFAILLAISSVDWERSAVKAFCDLNLPTTMIRVLWEHHTALTDGKFPLDPRGKSFVIEGIFWESLCRLLEFREAVECLCDVSDAGLSQLFNICTAESHGSERVKRLRSAALKAVSRIATAPESCGLALTTYLQAYGVIGRFIQRLSASYKTDWLVEEFVEACGVLTRLIRSLSQYSFRIAEELEAADGYKLLENLLLWTHRSESSMRGGCGEDALGELIQMVVGLIFLSSPTCKTAGQSAAATKLATGGIRVCNARPFEVLIDSFLSSESHELRRVMLETIVDVYASHRDNYRILHAVEPSSKTGQAKCRGIWVIIDRLETFEEDLAETALQTVLHLITVLGCRPEQELLALGRLLASEPSLQIQMIICRCLNEVVEHDSAFRDILRELGILKTLVQIVLHSYARSHEPGDAASGAETVPARPGQDHVNILMIESLAVIVRGHPCNARIVREHALPCLLQLVWNDTLHSSSLRLIGHISRSGTDEDTEACIAGLCEMLHSDPGDRVHQRLLTADVFSTLFTMAEHGDVAQSAFRIFGGFDILVDTLSRLRDHFKPVADDDFCNAREPDGSLVPIPRGVLSPVTALETFTENHAMHLLQAAVALLTIATACSQQNYEHVWRRIGLGTILQAVACTGVLRSNFCDAAIQLLAALACGRPTFELWSLLPSLFDQEHGESADQGALSEAVEHLGRQTWFAEPVLLLINLCDHMSLTNAKKSLNFVVHIAKSRPDHAQRLAAAGTLPNLRKMLVKWPHEGHLSKHIAELMAAIGSVCIDSEETGSLLRLCWGFDTKYRSLLVPALAKMASTGQSCTYLRFCLDADNSRALARMPISASERMWPPPSGYSFACWIYIESYAQEVLRLFQLSATSTKGVAPEQHCTTISINRHLGCLQIQSSANDQLTFTSFRFQERMWYQLVVVHSHHRMQSSVAALYVNGLLREQGNLRSGISIKTAMLSQVHGMVHAAAVNMTAIFGSISSDMVQSTQCWRLRGALLVEEPLPPESIYDLYWTGQAYGNYHANIPECDEIGSSTAAFIYKAIDTTDETEFKVCGGSTMRAWTEKLVLSAHFCFASGNFAPEDSQDGDLMNGADGSYAYNSVEKKEDIAGGFSTCKKWMIDGGVAVISCRTLCDAIRAMGGMSTVLALLEQSNSSTDLLHLLILLRHLLCGNVYNLCQMARIKGYEVLGRIFQSKAHLIDSKIVLEIMRVIGLGSNRSLAIVANTEACRHLIVDFRVWRAANPQLVSEAFYGLTLFINHNIRRKYNTKKLKEINLVPFLCLHLCQQHLLDSGVDRIVDLLSAFLTLNTRQSDLQEVANLVLIAAKRDKTLDQGQSGTPGKADEPKPLQALRTMQSLLVIILEMVRGADMTTIEGVGVVLEPSWFASLLIQIEEAGTLCILILILAGLVRSENFIQRLKASSVLLLLRDCLDRYHNCEALYLAIFQLMVGKYITSGDDEPPQAFDLALLREVLPKVRLVLPEVLPLILHMLRSNMKFEMSLAERTPSSSQEDTSVFSSSSRCPAIDEDSECCNDVLRGRDIEPYIRSLVETIVDIACEDELDRADREDMMLREAQGRKRCLSAPLSSRLDDVTLLNWTTASFLLFIYDRNPTARAEFLRHELIEAIVGLLFLADDAIDLQDPSTSDEGPAFSKVKEHVLRHVGNLFRTADRKVHGDPTMSATGESDEEGDELMGAGPLGKASSEVLSSCSLHDRWCTFSTATGEIIFQLLSRVTEEAIRTQPKGILAVYAALESIPLATPVNAERGFAGRLLSSLSKYLYVGSVELDVLGDSDLVKNLEQLCELIVDTICVESYPVAHSSPLDFIILIIHKVLETEARTQDFPVLVARHLGTLHRTANRLALHLLLRLRHHPERLQAVVRSLADRVAVVFGPYNNEAPVLMLIGHALFTLFFHEVQDVRRCAMKIWGHLLETKQPVMLALLSYTDGAGVGRSLFHDGFEKLLPDPSAPSTGGPGDSGGQEQSVDRFSVWLAGGLQNGLLLDQHKWLEEYRLACRLAVASSANVPASSGLAVSGNAARAAKIAKILADNARKQRNEVLNGAHKRLAQFLSRHQKNRTARLRRRAIRAHEACDQVLAARAAAGAAREASLTQWGRLIRRRLQNLESRGVYTAERWSRRRAELLRERGVFGTACCPEPGSKDSCVEIRRPLWWRLDSSEGPLRMRRRLELDMQEMARPRYQYNSDRGLHVPIRSAFRNPIGPGAGGATSGARGESPQDMLEPPCMTARLRWEADVSGNRRGGGLVSQLMSQDITQRLLGFYSSEVAGDAAGAAGVGSGIIDDDKFQWLLEPGDQIAAVYNCARLSSGSTVFGVCVFCSSFLYVFDGCLVRPSGEVSMFFDRSCPTAPPPDGTINVTSPVAAVHPSASNEIGPLAAAEAQAVRRWAHADIRDIQRRNYLLRPVGIEIFTSDGLNCLLIFHKAEREAVFERLSSLRGDCAPDPADDRRSFGASTAAAPGSTGEAAVDLTDSSRTLELASARWTGQRSIQTLLKKLCRLWQVGEISNFQYLMHLNTLAGRSYNDLTQYPVFPWIIADYTSTELDLSNPRTFRDLSKPMGAQDPGRAAEYRRRYDEWLEPDPEHPMPRFHYATHYSSAAAVTYYLLRLEPFTSAHVQLQGGKVDHGDRLFASVKECWESASKASVSDVKELTPEFFYLPDFLLNVNRVDLGVRQRNDGGVVDNVELPPWAHGSADDFVRRQRQALESEYVSARLHEWIDLIFGYKQRGPAAVAALNVFHHLTYEGAVDVDAIVDPVERVSTIAQILNFGQTPTQLFVKPHPKRDPAVSLLAQAAAATVFNSVSAAGKGSPLVLSGGSVSGGSSNGGAWGWLMRLVTGLHSLERHVVREPNGAGPAREVRVMADGRIAVALGYSSLCPVAPSESVRWGYPDGGLRHYIRLERAPLQRDAGDRLVGLSEALHVGGVSVAAFSEDGSILVTGGGGGDIAVWDFRRDAAGRSATWSVSGNNSSGNRGASGLPRPVRLRERLCGHVGRVTCLSVCKSYGVILSGAADCSVLMWDLNRLRFIRELTHSLPAPPCWVSLIESGAAVTVCAGKELRLLGINGGEIACQTAETAEDGFMCAVALPAPEWVLDWPMFYTGHVDGAIRLWQLVPRKKVTQKVEVVPKLSAEGVDKVPSGHTSGESLSPDQSSNSKDTDESLVLPHAEQLAALSERETVENSAAVEADMTVTSFEGPRDSREVNQGLSQDSLASKDSDFETDQQGQNSSLPHCGDATSLVTNDEAPEHSTEDDLTASSGDADVLSVNSGDESNREPTPEDGSILQSQSAAATHEEEGEGNQETTSDSESVGQTKCGEAGLLETTKAAAIEGAGKCTNRLDLDGSGSPTCRVSPSAIPVVETPTKASPEAIATERGTISIGDASQPVSDDDNTAGAGRGRDAVSGLGLVLVSECGGRNAADGGIGHCGSGGVVWIGFWPEGGAMLTGDEAGRVLRWDAGRRPPPRWSLSSGPSLWL